MISLGKDKSRLARGMNVPETMRIGYEELKGVMVAVLRGVGMAGERAEVCGGLFADASRDGVASHGVNRFAGFVKHLQEEVVVRDAVAKKVGGVGAMERWDGGYGVGPLNARSCMGRAVELAGMFGIGCVALGRTNHWMRAGNYGWQAAEAGCVGICWTNATPTMAAWGGKGRSVGNNPLVMAVPRANGEHVVLDMAMSQFSFGKLGMLERAGVEAPLVAGFDGEGKETTNPGKILRGGTLMPIGLWKGSGMGMVMDMIAAGMAGGMASWEVGKRDGGIGG